MTASRTTSPPRRHCSMSIRQAPGRARLFALPGGVCPSSLPPGMVYERRRGHLRSRWKEGDHDGDRMAPCLAQAPARRDSPAARAGFWIPSLGRRDGSRDLAGRRAQARHRRRGRGRGAAEGPNVTTFANLWAAGRIDLVNGASSISSRPAEGADAGIAEVAHVALDRARARPVPVRAARRPWPLEASSATARATARRPRTPATSPTTTTSPTPSTGCGSTATWSTPAPISMTGATISTRRSGRSST